MNSSQLLQEFMAYPKFGAGICLHRMRLLHDQLRSDFPTYRPDFIKVTGSNGKGSTCAILASLLNALNIQAGCFTSPHVLRFSERIAIDQAPISANALQAAKDWVDQAIHQNQIAADDFGGFERLTAMALYHFAANQVPHGVFEAGIGGRYDPVRVLPGNICALTSLDLEHTQLLGKSLELIAYDKLDLCPNDGIMVLFPIEDTDLQNRIETYAKLRNIHLVDAANFIRVSNVVDKGASLTIDINLAELSFPKTHVSLSGTHQISNIQVALTCFSFYVYKHWPKWEETIVMEAIRQGLAKVSTPGRLEHRPGPPDIHLDIAHTPQAIDAFVAGVRPKLRNQKVLLVMGVSSDKPVSQMVASLLPLADEVVCTQAYERGTPVAEITKQVASINPQIPLHEAETIDQAVDFAKAHAAKHGMTIVIAGGLFLVTEAMRYLDGNDPKQTAF